MIPLPLEGVAQVWDRLTVVPKSLALLRCHPGCWAILLSCLLCPSYLYVQSIHGVPGTALREASSLVESFLWIRIGFPTPCEVRWECKRTGLGATFWETFTCLLKEGKPCSLKITKAWILGVPVLSPIWLLWNCFLLTHLRDWHVSWVESNSMATELASESKSTLGPWPYLVHVINPSDSAASRQRSRG